MLKKIIILLTVVSANNLSAAAVDLYSAPLSSLNQFHLNQKAKKAARGVEQDNALLELSQTQAKSQTIVRYQQTYKGIPVVGGQVMMVKGTVNGHILNDIQVETTPSFNATKALTLAKQKYFSANTMAETHDEASVLQIRPSQDDATLKLVYLVSFKTVNDKNKPVWPFIIIDAQTGAVIEQWNNVKTYVDTGPGGNEKTQEYWYGKNGLPGLTVQKVGTNCVMDTPEVRLVNLNSAWDYNNTMIKPFQYGCDKNTEENINRSYSPTNDAYFFGHTIVNMYKNWYGLNVLQNPNGTPMKLIMRVHFGTQYDNAHWYNGAMSFGDGKDLYPLVSLDVAGHEVSHGFTEQHSDLEYHGQSGSLNESFSDMAGQASRAFLLEQQPLMYSSAYLGANQVSWGFAETIVPAAFGVALRFMDFPSSDGSSADCLDKRLAQSSGAYCAISYDEVVAFAEQNFANPADIESYIVHTGSGVFNKAFYLMAGDLGIKESFQMMLLANTKYWTPTTQFVEGACGVLHAAKDLKVDTKKVKNAFNQVGITTISCGI